MRCVLRAQIDGDCYWNGAEWTALRRNARVYDDEAQARKEIAAPDGPRERIQIVPAE